ncbi:MAG: hypothetical protein AVDCRST_MAG77-4175 [uncultured Chloroflexi bacterium]|uniref:Major facilitator superfamily (MFS) profile domain-containing protein n=1 Tax=uncultured Chloroflexota bacterium TaxID=166587 RepID=A0A6J4JR10_9CHLR|nr:MAG: hypothetical protein AVDCRST_MAG77-4175 [uncultured Chloroflexota bacterium]
MPGALTALWAWLFVCLGLSIAILGPAIPELRTQFSVSLGAAGALFSVHSAGYFVGVLVAGPFADRRGRRGVTTVGAVLLALGMALAALAPNMAWFLGAMVPAGLGFAAVDVGLNAAIGDAVVDPRRRAAAMNLLHGAFPLGTLAAPAGLALAWSVGMDWRAVFVCISAITTAAAVTAMAQRGRWPERVGQQQTAGGERAGNIDSTAGSSVAAGAAPVSSARPARTNSMLVVLREARLVRLAVLIGLYVGVELGIAGWIATYLIEEFQTGEGAGALSTSVYWGGFLVGRPVLAWITHRFGPGRTLPWMMAAGLVTGLAGVLAPSALTATAAFLGTGLAVCGVFPTVMALALQDRRGDAGVVTALITAAASIGGLVLPWLVGAVADSAGIRIAMTTAVAPLLVMLPLAWASRHDGAAGESAVPAGAAGVSIHST